MKTSNKLLLTGLSLVVVLITTIHLTLYAKIKKGDYTVYQMGNELEGLPANSYTGVSFITVRNLNGAIIHFDEKTVVEKTREGILQCIQTGDTLIITGRDPSRNFETAIPLNITLPYNAVLQVSNSSITFQNGKADAKSNSMISLDNSSITFQGNRNPLALGQLNITAAGKSSILFNQNIRVNQLDVQLSKSSLDYKDGDINQLSIITDSASSISLPSKLLLKAKITTAAPIN